MPLVLLPFPGSGFVPTDPMPAGLRWFAEYQPFTHHRDRAGAAARHRHRHQRHLAIAWCIGITLVGYLWAKKLYNRDPAPAR
jgi:ABC-2 type transport system permease protein